MTEQKASLKETVRNWAIVVCALGIFSLIAAQVEYAKEATELAIALFNALQLLLSLGFAWILSGSVSQSHFQEMQKKFAMAAFRRIKEIERALLRLHPKLPLN